MKVTILGNGGFGTALALVATRAGHTVAMLGHDSAYTAAMAQSRRNPRYLPDVELPPQIQIGVDAASALEGAHAVIVAVPTQHVRGVIERIRSMVPSRVPLISASKGLEATTTRRPSEVLEELLSHHPVFVLSGPSHAEEVALDLPTTVVLAGKHETELAQLQNALSTQRFRIYRNSDLLGVELCGALKNVIALAAGIADGLGFGDNTKAAIVTRGLVEISRFGVAAGAEPQTFSGLAGVGDLVVTAFSRHGRNREFGERIGRGESVQQILAGTRKVAEGVFTAQVVQRRAQAMAVAMPLCDAVCGVLFGGVSPLAAVGGLMERDRKQEWV